MLGLENASRGNVKTTRLRIEPLHWHWRDKLSCIAQKGGPLHDGIKGEAERLSKNNTEEDGERRLRPSRSIICETWVIDEAMTGPGMMPAIPSERKCQE